MERKSIMAKPVLLLLVMSIAIKGLCQCVQPFEQGTWFNNDAATRGITKIQVSFSCNDVVLCGVDANGNVTCTDPGAPFHLHLWGKCSPSDCDWGTVDGNVHWVGSTRWVYSFYDQGFARRYVYIKPSTLHPGNLYLWMYTQFTDPHRAPYVFTGWYHR
jgi:hypothetical protein